MSALPPAAASLARSLDVPARPAAPPRSCSLSAARDALRALSLAELDQRARLLHRQDSKYLVAEAGAAQLLSALAGHYEVLEIAGERGFRYDSTYFDSPDLRLYRDHAQGRRLRWKARTRRYGDGPLCYRELKVKGTRGSTDKVRERIRPDEHGAAGTGLTAFVDRELRAHYGTGLDVELVPTLSVRYERTTLVSVDGVERVTLDRALDVVDADGRVSGRLRPGLALLEVKTPNGRGQADRALSRLGVRPVSVSKYSVGVALTHPQVTANLLRPVLRDGFLREGVALEQAA